MFWNLFDLNGHIYFHISDLSWIFLFVSMRLSWYKCYLNDDFSDYIDDTIILKVVKSVKNYSNLNVGVIFWKIYWVPHFSLVESQWSWADWRKKMYSLWWNCTVCAISNSAIKSWLGWFSSDNFEVKGTLFTTWKLLKKKLLNCGSVFMYIVYTIEKTKVQWIP